LVVKKFTKRSSSRGDQIRLNKLIKVPFKAAPSFAQFAPRRNVFWQLRVKHAQSGSEHATVRLGEKHGDPATQTRESIPLRAGDFGN